MCVICSYAAPEALGNAAETFPALKRWAFLFCARGADCAHEMRLGAGPRVARHGGRPRDENLKRLGPALRSVIDGEDHDAGLVDGVGHEERGIGDDQLARARNASGAA